MQPGSTFIGVSGFEYGGSGGIQEVGPADIRKALINGWTPQAYTSSQSAGSTLVRAIALGDSHLGFGFGNGNIATTAGSFVVSGGIATITYSSNHNIPPGNYVQLHNLGDTSVSLALNGATVQVLTATSNTVLTVPATFNGVTMADGDYSSVNSTGWVVKSGMANTDSSLVRYLNAFAGNPLIWIADHAIVGGTAAQTLAMLPKILAGPRFDIAFLSAGTNEVGGGTPKSPVTISLALAQDCYQNIVSIAKQLVSYGAKVVILTSFPLPATISNAINSNMALNQLRQQLIGFQKVTPGVYLLDTFKDSILGTSATGDFITNYAHTTSDVHMSSYGHYEMGKREASFLSTLVPAAELSPVSLIDDGSTFAQLIAAWAASTAYTVTTVPAVYVTNFGNIYCLIGSGTSAAAGNGPSGTGSFILDGTCIWAYAGLDTRNMLPHGMMDGTAGTNSVSGSITGNVPTGWFLTTATNCTGTTASQQTRQGAANTNQANWGYGWNLNLTFSAAGSIQMASGDWGSRWRSAVANFGGGWFRFGLTVTALADFSAINNFSYLVKVVTATAFAQVTAGQPSNNTTTIPVKNGDTFELVTDPFYVQPGVASAASQWFMTVASSGAGSANFQVSNIWCKRVPNPYA